MAAPGDVQLVALDDVPIELYAATARVDAFHLDDCAGGTETLLVGETIDLLAPLPVPETLPPGDWCSIAVDFTADPTAGSLHLAGITSGGTSFTIDLDPGLVVVPGSFFVDGDEWVLILDASLLVDPAPIEAQGATATVGPADADAEVLEADLPGALLFLRVWEARDVVYIDLWPFDDVVFDFGSGNIEVRGGGCNVDTPPLDLDLDGDGIPSSQDDDDDGDGVLDGDDPDRDGDGVDDGSDPDGGSGGGDGSSGSGSGCNGDGGSSGGCDGDGGSSGGSSSGCDGGGDGADCSGSSSSGGSDCSGSSGGGSDCSSDCSGAECATVGFAPPWAVGASVFVLLRRRRRAPG